MEIIPKKPRRPVWIVFFLSIFQKKVPRISEKHGKNQKKQWFYSRKYPTFSYILTYDNILIAIMKGVWGRISAPQFSQKRRASSTLTTPSRTRQRITTKISSSDRSVRSAIVRRSAPGLSRRADRMTNLAHDSIGRIRSPRLFRVIPMDHAIIIRLLLDLMPVPKVYQGIQGSLRIDIDRPPGLGGRDPRTVDDHG